VLSRAVLCRLVPLVAAGAALACAVVPAGAHEGQDDRPGAAQMDLEVLITPPINGETSPGGHDPAVAVDGRGNVIATALKEELQPATVDGRSPSHVRAGSWRWSSGDDGLTFVNVAGQPFQADTLAPGGRSVAAAADDRGRGFLLESHDGIGVLTVTRSAEKDDIAVDTVRALPAGAVLGRTRIAAHGDGRLFVLAAPRSGPTYVSTGPPQTEGYALYRSDDAGASFSDLVGVNLDRSEQCDVAAGHAPRSKQVLVACSMSDASVAAFSSFDDGRTFRQSTVVRSDRSRILDRPSVAVGPDGTASVLVTTTNDGSRERTTLSLLRSKDRGKTWRRQDVAAEPGQWSGASLATNQRGRLAVAAYHRTNQEAGWHVRLATFDAGRRPVYVDFASHDPVTPKGWFNAPTDATALTAGPDSRFHLLWTSIKVVVPSDVVGNDTSLIRNVWSVRTLST
jgi:hypothetical protein